MSSRPRLELLDARRATRAARARRTAEPVRHLRRVAVDPVALVMGTRCEACGAPLWPIGASCACGWSHE